MLQSTVTTWKSLRLTVTRIDEKGRVCLKGKRCWIGRGDVAKKIRVVPLTPAQGLSSQEAAVESDEGIYIDIDDL